MQVKQIKMLEPLFPNRSTGLINGEASGVLNWDDIAYPNLYRVYEELSKNYWLPEEVAMAKDIKDYKSMTPEDKTAFELIIGLLATLDSPQTRFISQVASSFSDVAVQTNMAIVGQQEAIHNQSYSYILSSITNYDEQKRIFDEARTHPTVVKRNKPIMDAYDTYFKTRELSDLLKALVQSSILEGINFYSGFAYFYNLARQQRMVGTSSVIAFINRDELAHSKFISELIQMILAEHPEENTEELINYTVNSLKHAVELETDWSKEVLANVTGITLSEMEGYVRYRANKMASMLGLKPIYPGYSDNPMRWIKAYEDNLNGTKTDFFEEREKNYKKVSDNNGFDEL